MPRPSRVSQRLRSSGTGGEGLEYKAMDFSDEMGDLNTHSQLVQRAGIERPSPSVVINNSAADRRRRAQENWILIPDDAHSEQFLESLAFDFGNAGRGRSPERVRRSLRSNRKRDAVDLPASSGME